MHSSQRVGQDFSGEVVTWTDSVIPLQTDRKTVLKYTTLASALNTNSFLLHTHFGKHVLKVVSLKCIKIKQYKNYAYSSLI